MSEHSVTGLIFWGFVAFLVYWYYTGRRKPKTQEGSLSSYGEGEDNAGPRRPYVFFGGELREVLHRRKKGDRVECTLRPKERGGPRSKITVQRDCVIWAEKGEGR